MRVQSLFRAPALLALLLVGCSEPTGLPRAVNTPGAFSLALPDGAWAGTAHLEFRESEGEIIVLTETEFGRRIEIAVGRDPNDPSLSELPTRSVPTDYVRWVRVVMPDDPPASLMFLPLRGSSYEGIAGTSGTRLQLDLRLRLWTNELAVVDGASAITPLGDTAAEFRVRGALWAVWPPM